MSCCNDLLDSDMLPDVLPLAKLQSLCKDSCRAELVALRSSITAHCQPSTDVIVYNKVAYPASYLVELHLQTFDVSCYREKSVPLLH